MGYKLILSYKVACVEMIPSAHHFLSKDHCRLEASAVLNRFLVFLSNIPSCTPSYLCALLNASFSIIKMRKEYALALTSLLVQLKEKNLPLSDFGKRSVYRTLKVVLLSCYSLPSVESLEEGTEQVLKEFGVKPRELLLKQKVRKELKSGGGGRKVREQVIRTATLVQPSFEVATRVEPMDLGPIDDELILASEILRRGRVQFEFIHQSFLGCHTFRFDLVYDAIIASVASRDVMLLQSDLERYILVGGMFDPSYRAPGRQAIMSGGEEVVEVVVKEEEEELVVDIDIEAILNSVDILSIDDIQHNITSSFDRILAMEYYYPTVGKKDIILAKNVAKDSVVASRNGWMLLVVRMVSRTPLELQKHLIDWVVGDFGKRMDVLIFWLLEEYMRGDYDKALLQVLGVLSVLDTKDRIYTRFPFT
jgi:hypothetical protein